MIEEEVKTSFINNTNSLLEAEDQFNIEPIAKRLTVTEIKTDFAKLETEKESSELVWLMGFVGCFLKEQNHLYIFDDSGFIKVLIDKNTSLLDTFKSGDLIGVLGNICRYERGELVLKQQRILITSSENYLSKLPTKKQIKKTNTNKFKSNNNTINISSDTKSNEIKIASIPNTDLDSAIKEPLVEIKDKKEPIQIIVKKKNKQSGKSLIYAFILANLFFLSGQAVFMNQVYSLATQQKENFYNFATKYYRINKEDIPLLNIQNTESELEKIDKQKTKNNKIIKDKVFSWKNLSKLTKKKNNSSAKKITKNLSPQIINKIEEKKNTDLEILTSVPKAEKEEVKLINPEKVLFKPIQLPETKEAENQIKILGNEQNLNQYSQYETQIIKPAREVKAAEAEKLISKAKNTNPKNKKSVYFFSDLIENSKTGLYKNRKSEPFENQ
jgi:hypothetical protein